MDVVEGFDRLLPRTSHLINKGSAVWKERNRRLNDLTHGKTNAATITTEQQQIMDVELWEAAKNGDVDEFIICLEKLTSQNNNVSTIIRKLTVPHQDTLLHVAARHGQEELAGWIADNFQELVASRNNKGNSPLHLAARYGHLGVVAMFLRVQQANQVEKGKHRIPPPNTNREAFELVLVNELVAVNDEGNTALHEAMLYDHKDVASCLIECNIEAAYFVNREGKSPLHMAAEAGNIEHVRNILLATSDYMHLLDKQLIKGKSLLHSAIRAKNLEILQAIVETKPMHMNVIEEDGLSPLDFSLSTGFLEGVKFLKNCSKKRTIDVNIADNDLQKNTPELRKGSTNGMLQNQIGQLSQQGRSQLGKGRTMSLELYECAKKGDIASFHDFLNSERTVVSIYNHKTPQQNTLLHVAAKFRKEELTKFILDNSPSLLFEKNHRGDTALHVAAAAGHLPLVRILFEFQLKTDSLLNVDINWFNERVQVNNNGNTPLHLALMNKQTEVVEYLIEVKLEDAYYVNKQGNSALYMAIEANYIDFVRTIFNSGLHYDYRYIQHQKVTPGKSLILAAMKVRHKDLLLHITKMKNAVKIFQNETGQTLLHYAISTNLAWGVEVLLCEQKMDIIKKGAGGLYPIHCASKYGRVDILAMLLDYCPDEFATEDGQNILHVATHYGKYGVVKYILNTPRLEILLNEKDKNGDTPLHLAAKNSHPRIASLLTWDKRIDITLSTANNEGLTAMDIAHQVMAGFAGSTERNPYPRPLLTLMTLDSAGAPNADPKSFYLKTTDQQDSWKDRVNTLLLVSTLIATVTFAAGFTMPGGYNNSEPHPGMATLLNKRALQIFVICDTIAMYSAILVCVTLIWAQLNIQALVIISIRFTMPVLAVSLIFMSLAFMAAVSVVVNKLVWLSYVVFVLGILFVAGLLTLLLPLSLPMHSASPIFRYSTYFFFHLVMWASGCYIEPPVDLYHPLDD